jgi:aminoglycoside phosphotransferase family enzyme
MLNRRLTTNIYLDVVAITFKKGQYYLSGPGRPFEYAVNMRQLPHLNAFKDRFEPLDDLSKDIHIRVGTEKPLAESVHTILSHEHVVLSRIQSN